MNKRKASETNLFFFTQLTFPQNMKSQAILLNRHIYKFIISIKSIKDRFLYNKNCIKQNCFLKY